ncbi:MAG: type II toxin-antitoxin system RelE/ParE family toxin [Bryobacter sp.]|jgi:mRNA-degrading endonuclease RelE of RelBE toxin-antitoxin system|nr:type II toxin-antitoxin system RelE/ParE family toxin [Bryobacter sp. CoA8 C33]
MAKRVAFTGHAKAELRAIPQPAAIQILRTLARFLASEEGNVKRLQGVEPPLYRLRTQDHRVIFRHLGDDLIEVTRVRDRKDAYR